ncbi:helix-turn-helix domain-containing protein [Paenibacillus mesophilus]|uniref:helix-turn-helix domain-containing protein n=1 Tax=Paenibacillus mesophilus TaxID=2582849 RepID=UPI00130508F8|nr:helix-turn-helix domain-containing protein [Paenibacillus mesophilus]
MKIKRKIESFRGQRYFRLDFPVYVNRVRETFDLKEHSHDFVEIAYVAEGKGFHYIGDQIVPVRKGDLFYIPVGTSHVFRPADGAARQPLIVSNCIFGLELFDRIIQSHSLLLPSEQADALIAIRNRSVWLRAEEHSTEARNLMQQLYQEYVLRREGRRMMIVTFITQLLFTLARSIYGSRPEPVSDSASRIEAAIRCIQQNINAPLSLADISSKINIGTRQFHRLIKKATGQTYTDYVHSLQIERCCELLRTTDQKVYEIAETTGFKDLKHFHAIFKRKTGLSPREYRNQSRV